MRPDLATVWSRRAPAAHRGRARARAAPHRTRRPALGEAMRYAVLGGGKRLRPLLAYAAGEPSAADPALRRRAGCAVELIHAYSLVHDDLPCMDDDVAAPRQADVPRRVRRGDGAARGRCAAGAGVRGAAARSRVRRSRAARCARCSPTPAGAAGMAGGQAIDLAPRRQAARRCRSSTTMHRLKTGALIGRRAMGAALRPRRSTAARRRRSTRYARAPGLAFQVVDDILDVEGSPRRSARPPARTRRSNKPTYVTLLGLAEAQRHAAGAARRGARRARAVRRRRRAACASSPTGSSRARRRLSSDMTASRCSKRIDSPGRPAPARRARSCAQLARELRAFLLQVGRADRRPPVVEPRHGRADDRAALRLRHAARPHGLGRRPPDLPAQDPDRPARAHGHAAPEGRPLRLPAPQRKRVRHVRHRAFVDVDLGRARHGDRARKLKGEERHVVAVIGDGAMSAGMAFEALNNAAAAPNLLVILNDNEMSISRAGRRVQPATSRKLLSRRALQHGAPRRQGSAVEAAAGARARQALRKST